MYIMGENPAMSDPDVEHAREALAKLEHLVVQDIFLTETAKYADVILPASAFPEKDGHRLQHQPPGADGPAALPLPGNARLDWWIIQEIARRIGLDWSYAHPRDVFAEMKQAMPSLDNITWERLERESSVTYPCDAEDQPGNEIIFGDGFPTDIGPRAAGPGCDHPAGRGARCRISDGADHRPPARTLAHRRDDAAGECARRDSSPRPSRASRPPNCAGSASPPASRSASPPAAATIELKARERQRGRAGPGVHPVLLCRSRRERADQPAARPVRQDPRIQILRRPRRARRDADRGRIIGSPFDRRIFWCLSTAGLSDRRLDPRDNGWV